MRIKLVTLYDSKMAAMGEASARLMSCYCQRNGYEFVAYKHLPNPRWPAQWNKLLIIRQELGSCDWLLWMDADSVPVNPDFKIEDLLKMGRRNLIISSDSNGPCAGIFAIRNCEWSVRLLEAWLFCGQMDREYARRYHPSPQNDQPTLIALLHNFPGVAAHTHFLAESIVCNPRNEFNPSAFAVHYWASDNNFASIIRKMGIIETQGWVRAAHKHLTIVTAADGNMADMLAISEAQNIRWGYNVVVYDINGEIGHGIRFDFNIHRVKLSERKQGTFPCKPQVIAKELEKEGGLLVWMDADAFAIRAFDEVDTGDYDIGVTMRRQAERGSTRWPLHYGFLNTGVIFVNRTDGAQRFMAMWQSEVEACDSHSDQEAMNRLVLQATDLTEYEKVFDLQGIRIKVFNCEDYNYFYWPQEPHPTTKIVHCKGDVRSAIYDWGRRKW